MPIDGADDLTGADADSLELVCVGLATLDTIVRLPSWPTPDSRQLVDGFVRAGGGPAATAAVAAAAQGRRVAFVGAVGEDAAADEVRAGLAAVGVDVRSVASLPGATAQSVILVDAADGARTILHAPGVTLPALTPASRRACERARWVHVDHAGWPLVSGLPRDTLSVDAGNPITGLELAGLGLYAPTATALRERYPGRGVGTGIGRALDEGARRVAVTLGGRGALAADASGAWRVGPCSVALVSTLGAGDVFHGVLVAALADGRQLPEALRRANLAAALSCRGIDGRGAIPDRAELEAALPAAPPAEAISLSDTGLDDTP